MRAMSYAPREPSFRPSRTPLLVALGVVAALVLGSGLWVLKSWASVRADLEADGYASPKVTFKGPFSYAFRATKGTSSCSGTITRYPGGGSTEETCFDTTPAPPAAPPTSNRVELENRSAAPTPRSASRNSRAPRSRTPT